MDKVTTSWRRLSDEPQKHADARGTCCGHAPPAKVNESQQVAAWENEGGQSALPTKLLRILIVDDDIESSSSMPHTVKPRTTSISVSLRPSNQLANIAPIHSAAPQAKIIQTMTPAETPGLTRRLLCA